MARVFENDRVFGLPYSLIPMGHASWYSPCEIQAHALPTGLIYQYKKFIGWTASLTDIVCQMLGDCRPRAHHLHIESETANFIVSGERTRESATRSAKLSFEPNNQHFSGSVTFTHKDSPPRTQGPSAGRNESSPDLSDTP